MATVILAKREGGMARHVDFDKRIAHLVWRAEALERQAGDLRTEAQRLLEIRNARERRAIA